MNAVSLLKKCCNGMKMSHLVFDSSKSCLLRIGSVMHGQQLTAVTRAKHVCDMRNFQYATCKCVLSGHSWSYQRNCEPLLSAKTSYDRQVRNFGKAALEVVNRSPPMMQPYLKLLRIDRPIGTWLLFWPGAWSIGLAAESGCIPDIRLLFLFGVGALIMRGAGCIINDMWDKNIDAKVSRTRDRPIASGQISRLNAFVFLTGMLAVGDVVLLNLNWESILLGTGSLGLIACYPLVKRLYNWPQLCLGLVFNWGAMLGWTAVKGVVDIPVCLSLYFACIFWTLIYDTVYALQDKKDDISIGVKSTAITFGPNVRKYLIGFSGVMMTGLTITGIMCQQTVPYYLALSIALARVIHQTITLNINDPEDCGKKFISHSYLGWIIMSGIILGTLFKEVKT